MFHAQAVRLIREHGGEPNEAMRAVWEYEHDRIMERDAEILIPPPIFLQAGAGQGFPRPPGKRSSC